MKRGFLAAFSLIIIALGASAQHTTFWGLTHRGGITDDVGVIFKYNYVTNTFTKVYEFNPSGGYYSHGTLAYSSTNGLLYGTTYTGGWTQNGRGGLFSFNPATQQYTWLFTLNPPSLGASLLAPLVQVRPGYFWSTSLFGGTSDKGTIYTYDANTGTHAVRKHINPAIHGFDAYDAPVLAPNGKLYGLAGSGPDTGKGVLYQLDTTTYAYTVRKRFLLPTGGEPKGRLLLASDGNFYSTTAYGGAANGGTLFRYNYTTDSLTHLVQFDTVTGRYCYGRLIQASDGHIYGVTTSGGDSMMGTVFRYNLATATFTRLASFHWVGTGARPYGGLVQAPDGKLYGLAQLGGTHGKGTLFSFDIATNTITKKVDFNGANGSEPYLTDLTPVVTNAPPVILTNNLTDSTCAGTTDTLTFTIADPDNDTVRGSLVSSNLALVDTAGSSFSRVGGTNQYRLIYTSTAGNSGSVLLHVPFTDGWGATDTLRATVHLKVCPASPNALPTLTGAHRELTVSPNPASNLLRVQAPDADGRIIQVMLVDASGRKTVWNGSEEAEQAIPVSGLPRGIYNVVVVTKTARYSCSVLLR